MPAIAPFIPALTAATAIGSGVMQYKGQKDAQKATERAAQQEQADRARIAAEAEQTSLAQTAQQQEARKAFSQRLNNRSEVLRQELARQNLLGTPAGAGRQAEMEAEGVRSADRLSADLAGQGEQARQRALYSLPALSERGTQVQQQLGASNPSTALYGDLANLASTTFGRTQQGGGPTGYRLTTPGINPNAPTPLASRTPTPTVSSSNDYLSRIRTFRGN